MRTAKLLLIGAIWLSGCGGKSTTLPPSVQEGIVAHYQLNGNALDSSGNLQNGTNHGATATTGVDDSADSAMSFNGSEQNIDVPNELVSTSSLTISAWVKTVTDRAAVVSNNNGGPGRFDFSLEQRKFVVFVGGRSKNFLLESDELVGDDQWHMLTATLENGVWTLYVDSVKKVNATTEHRIDSSKDLRIGSSPTNDRNLVGSVDDVRFYSRALNQDEITAIYQARGK